MELERELELVPPNDRFTLLLEYRPKLRAAIGEEGVQVFDRLVEETALRFQYR